MLSIALVFAIFVPVSFAFSGCGRNDRNTPDIVVTTRPVYDWVRAIIGNDSNLTLGRVTCNGTTVQGVAAISSASLFINVGGKTEAWVTNALRNPQNTSRQVITLMHHVPDIELSGDQCCGVAHGDENVWNSLVNAMYFVNLFRNIVVNLDQANASTFTQRAADFHGELYDLHQGFLYTFGEGTLDITNNNPFVLADRNPFRHLERDYDITIFAAYYTTTATNDASPTRLIWLGQMVTEHSLNTIMYLQTTSYAYTVRTNSGNSNIEFMQLFCPQIHNMPFLYAMERNLETLRLAMGV